LVKLVVSQGLVVIVVEVNLKGVRVDMELPFALVALMLEVRVVNPSASTVLFDVLALNAENLDAVGKE